MKLSSENEFVTRLLRCFLRPKSLLPPGQEFDGIDWDKVISIAAHHNILTIIYHVLLKEGVLEKIPPEKAQLLEKDFIEKTAFILHYEHLLRSITRSLYQESIPFVIIKGPTLAYEFYDPIEVRSYGDLDLLINRRDYAKVKKLLSEHGFRVAHPETENHRRRFWNSVDFTYTKNQHIAVDLHWDTLMSSWGRKFLSGQDVWQDIRWLELPEMRLPVLNPAVLIQHLCLHLAFHHQFGKLQTLCDLDLAVRKFQEEIDWEKFLETSREMKIWKAVMYSLRLSEGLLGTELPEAIQRPLGDKTISEKLFPFTYLAFRSTEIPGTVGRIIRFLLIDDFRGKIQSMASFYRRLKAPKN